MVKNRLSGVRLSQGITSRTLVIVVSTEAIIVSNPSTIIMTKNKTAQKGAPLIVVTKTQFLGWKKHVFLQKKNENNLLTCIGKHDKAKTLAFVKSKKPVLSWLKLVCETSLNHTSLNHFVDGQTGNVGQITNERKNNESREEAGQAVAHGDEDGVAESTRAVKDQYLKAQRGWGPAYRIMLLLKSL